MEPGRCAYEDQSTDRRLALDHAASNAGTDVVRYQRYQKVDQCMQVQSSGAGWLHRLHRVGSERFRGSVSLTDPGPGCPVPPTESPKQQLYRVDEPQALTPMYFNVLVSKDEVGCLYLLSNDVISHLIPHLSSLICHHNQASCQAYP